MASSGDRAADPSSLGGENDGKHMIIGGFLQVCVFKCITHFDGKCSKRAILQLFGS